MVLWRFVVVATMPVAALAACGLDAVGEAAPDASLGSDSGGPDVGRDTHVASSDAHSSSDAHQSSSGSGSGSSSTSSSSGCPSPPDCSNDACKVLGYACEPAYPTGAGWMAASAEVGGTSSCPTGYTALPALITAPTNPAPQCTCTCAPGSSPSCTTDGQLFEVYFGMSSCGATDLPLNAGGGACAPASGLPANLMIHTPAPATGGSCTPTGDTTQPPPMTSSVDVCTTTTAPPPTGCAANQVCAATAAGQESCVYSPIPMMTCPTGYPTDHQVGTSVNDTRACLGTCGCGLPTATCANPTFTLYSGNSDCAPDSGTVIGTTCTVSNASMVANSIEYSASPTNIQCGAPALTYTPSGTAALMNPATLCCTP